MVGSNYKIDKKVESVVNEYFQKYFYGDKRFFPETDYTMEFIHDKIRQKKGIDVIINNNLKDRTTIIDEKCSAYYINRDLPTFAFEIMSRGKQGWLVKSGMKTDKYVLVWIFADKKKYPEKGKRDFNKLKKQLIKFNMNDIRYLKCYVIDKEKVLNFLSDNGFDKQQLIDKANYMISQRRTEDKDTRNKGFYFIRSIQIDEKPVNVIIRIEELNELAKDGDNYSCYIVDKSGTRKLFSSARQRDVIEEAVSRFLDSSVFPDDIVAVVDTKDSHHKHRITLNSGTSQQGKKIIDIITFEDVESGEAIRAEVKCSAYNVNSNLDTFAFEVQSHGKNGWLWEACPGTDGHMFLVWISTFDDIKSKKFPFQSGIAYDEFPLERLSAEEIGFLTCQLIRKETIINYLKSLGYDKKQLLGKARDMVKDGIERMDLNEDGVFLYHNTGLYAKSVNVVIPTTILKRLTDGEGNYFVFHLKKQMPKD